MKILHINGTSEGGTFNVIYDLHKALLKKKIKSNIYLPEKMNIKNSYYPKSFFFYFYSKIINLLKKIIRKILLRTNSSITLSFFKSFEIKKIIKKIKPDIIHLHWIGNEFISLDEIVNMKLPLVWTMHDLWLVHSYFHYEEKAKKNFFSKIMINHLFKKKNFLMKKKITIIPTSTWSYKKLDKKFQSIDNKYKKIPCGIDFTKWFPMNKQIAKKTLGLKNKPIVLFIAYGVNNSRKGFDYLNKSLKFIKHDYELLIVGDQKPLHINDKKYKFIFAPKNIKIRRLIYNSADLLVAPSIQEAFGLVCLEAAACNTPSVIFNDNGLEDIIKHKINGYVAKKKNVKDLGRGINWILSSMKMKPKRFNVCRSKVVKKYNIKNLANDYILVYKKLLNKNINYQKK